MTRLEKLTSLERGERARARERERERVGEKRLRSCVSTPTRDSNGNRRPVRRPPVRETKHKGRVEDGFEYGNNDDVFYASSFTR